MKIKAKHKKKFKELIEGLNELMTEIREYCPEANYYLANDNMHLLNGPSHDEGRYPSDDQVARQDRSASSVTLCGSGGGDW